MQHLVFCTEFLDGGGLESCCVGRVYGVDGVQMIIGVHRFLSNVNKSSVNVFITIINNIVAEASTCTMKYFNEASVLYMLLTLGIKGMNDIGLISRPIHAPNHELEDTDTNTPPNKAISKRIFVALLGIREESVILYLWGLNPLA